MLSDTATQYAGYQRYSHGRQAVDVADYVWSVVATTPVVDVFVWTAAQGLSGVLSYEHMEPFYARAAAAKERAGDRDGAHDLRKKMLRHKQRR